MSDPTKENSVNDQRLFQAVIVQAIQDATSIPTASTTDSELMEFARARRWFRQAGPDFQEICYLAGMEPDAVRRKALAAIEAYADGIRPRWKLPTKRKSNRKPRSTDFAAYKHNGEMLSVRQIAERAGITLAAAKGRLKKGWPIPRILATPTISREMRNAAYWSDTQHPR